MLQQRPIARAFYGVVRKALTRLQGVKLGEIGRPRTRECCIILQPMLTKNVGICIAPTIEAIQIIVGFIALQNIACIFVQQFKTGRLLQIIEHNHIFGYCFALVITHSAQHIVTYIAVFPCKMSTYAIVFFYTQIHFVGRIVVQFYTVAIAIHLDGSTAALLKPIGPCVRHNIHHRVGGGGHIIGPVHIKCIGGLFPRRYKSFVIEWP